MPLKRKQIYIDAESDKKIRRLAAASGLSEAEHIRRAIASYVGAFPETNSNQDPLIRMIGICESTSGPKDAAVNHDRYLYGKKR